MGYGRNVNRDRPYDVEDIKGRLREELPDVDLNKINQQDIKNILINEVEKNPNIRQDIKDKISQGDIDGLKDELIKYLDTQDGSDDSNKRVKNMLINNDFEGLQNELIGMFLKGASGQKKNEVESKDDKKAEDSINKNIFNGIFDDAFLNTMLRKFNEGNKNDSRVNLLNSIKPFMSDNRQKVIDECIKAVNLLAMMEKLGLKAGR